MNFVRENVQPEVADAVARLDNNFGDDHFGVCSVTMNFYTWYILSFFALILLRDLCGGTVEVEV